MKTNCHILRIIALALIAAISVLVAACNRGPKTLEFEPIDGQIALLERVYSVWFGARIDIPAQDAGMLTLCDWLDYKSRVARQSEGWEESQQIFLDNEMTLVTRTNINADYWASVFAYEWLEKLYNGEPGVQSDIIARCAQYTPELNAHLDDEIQSFRGIAQKEGWLDNNGRIAPSKRELVRLMHRYQWVMVTSNHFPYDRICPPEEMIAIFRYLVEVSDMALDKKLAHIDEMRRELPESYDYDFAEAVLYSKSGDSAGACAILKNALPNMHDEAQKKKYHQAIKALSQANSEACL